VLINGEQVNGTDEFFKAFIALSKVTGPFILYDLKTNKVIAVF